jgi:hypothetical protein
MNNWQYEQMPPHKQELARLGKAIADEKIRELRDGFNVLTNEQRLEIFEAVREGYCRHCGGEDPKHRCQCWNDE